MKNNNKYENQKIFWEKAGETGYDKAMFSCPKIASHIMSKHWKEAINIGNNMGLNNASKILELGCGDGKFANNILANFYDDIDAFDVSNAAIGRACSNQTLKKINFEVQDITSYKFDENKCWDAVFMMGFLHHVKSYVPDIISRLSSATDNIIIVEPNGDNVIRKTLELFPAYRNAGEDSFKLKELAKIMKENGYNLRFIKKLTFIPPFIPESLFPAFKILENIIENSYMLDNLCSTYILGFQK